MTDYYVNPYVKQCVRVFPEQGRYDYHRYDMNENPEGLPKEFVDNVLKEITPEFLATYPEPDVFLEKYARFIGVDFENVLNTNGSDMAIRYLMEVFGQTGKKVVTVSPSFEMYWVNCSILGLVHVPVNYKMDMTVDVEEIIAAIDDDTNIVVLLNPNNPIGTAYTEEEVDRIIRKAQEKNAVVIVDEAYHYFYKETFLSKIKEYDNVIVLRTFSKLFSIAACRIGVIISNPKIIEYVRKVRLTFETNSIALKFAERLLDNPQIIEGLIQEEEEGKQYTLEVLHDKGYEVKDGLGNYLFIKTKAAPKELAIELKEKEKILIKTFGSPILADYIRVSVGSKKAMEFFVEKFLLLDKGAD